MSWRFIRENKMKSLLQSDRITSVVGLKYFVNCCFTTLTMSNESEFRVVPSNFYLGFLIFRGILSLVRNTKMRVKILMRDVYHRFDRIFCFAETKCNYLYELSFIV